MLLNVLVNFEHSCSHFLVNLYLHFFIIHWKVFCQELAFFFLAILSFWRNCCLFSTITRYIVDPFWQAHGLAFFEGFALSFSCDLQLFLIYDYWTNSFLMLLICLYWGHFHRNSGFLLQRVAFQKILNVQTFLTPNTLFQSRIKYALQRKLNLFPMFL